MNFKQLRVLFFQFESNIGPLILSLLSEVAIVKYLLNSFNISVAPCLWFVWWASSQHQILC